MKKINLWKKVAEYLFKNTDYTHMSSVVKQHFSTTYFNVNTIEDVRTQGWVGKPAHPVWGHPLGIRYNQFDDDWRVIERQEALKMYRKANENFIREFDSQIKVGTKVLVKGSSLWTTVTKISESRHWVYLKGLGRCSSDDIEMFSNSTGRPLFEE